MKITKYSHALHNEILVDNGRHIQKWFHKIIILKYIILTIVLQLPTVFSTVTYCTVL